MDEKKAIEALKKLVSEYIEDPHKLTELDGLLSSTHLPAPPVRGVIDDIYRLRKKEISGTDKEVIDELMYYFG